MKPLSPQLVEELEKGIARLRSAYFFMFIPPLLCLAIGLAVSSGYVELGAGDAARGVKGIPMPEDVYQMLYIILLGLAAAELAAAFFLRKKGYGLFARRLAVLPNRFVQGEAAAIFGPYAMLLILACALCEPVAVYGLLLFLMRFDYVSFIAALVLTFVLLIMFRPSIEELCRLAQSADKGA